MGYDKSNQTNQSWRFQCLLSMDFMELVQLENHDTKIRDNYIMIHLSIIHSSNDNKILSYEFMKSSSILDLDI